MTDERIHKSLWTVTAPARRFPRLAGDMTVDVVVVGAGIAGLTAALLLKRAGKRVVVLEMNRILTGQTGQTTAHLTELLDTPYAKLLRDFGEKGARLAAASHRAAIEQMATLVDELRIDCGFQRVPLFRYAETERELLSLQEEVHAARLAGLTATFVPSVPLPYATKGALRVEDQAWFHPRRYCQALADAFEGGGCHLYEDTRVVEVHDGVPCRVVTEQGVVTATSVIEATTTPLNRLFLHTKLYPYRTYAVAARLQASLEPGLYYDSREPYHYIRTQQVDGEDWLIVGGEDHKVGHDDATDTHFAALEAYTLRRFPVGPVEHTWSGQVIEPADGLAYIGRNSHSRHTYVATGFSGNGMTYGTLAGMLVCDAVLGKQNPYAALYDATRVKPAAGARDFLQENADVALHFVVDRLSGPDARALSEVEPDEGRIVEVQGQKVAVYREEGGAVHAVSPVCTHLGCHVQWNRAERSWDCPCHGARYSPTGKVLNGPAVRDLASQKLPSQSLNLKHPGERHRMNALDLLKEQHQEVDVLFKRFKKLDEDAADEKGELFQLIADRLAAHATIEEQLFYPSVKNEDTEDLLRESLEEHLGVKRFIADLLALDPEDEQFDAKMEVLQENVEHHVEEEEKELFKRVRKGFSKQQLEDLGLQMQDLYEELMEKEPRTQVPEETDTAAPL